MTPMADAVKALISERDELAAENARLREALKSAREALTEYACHGGPTMPCRRALYQCAEECGKNAGDARLVVDAALASKETGHDA